LLYKNSVDLIVVAANKLDARKLFDKLKDIAGSLKNSGLGKEGDEDMDDDRRNRNEEGFDEEKKEAIVIWGSLEIPKLCSVSH
jgi:hypothetical protein